MLKAERRAASWETKSISTGMSWAIQMSTRSARRRATTSEPNGRRASLAMDSAHDSALLGGRRPQVGEKQVTNDLSAQAATGAYHNEFAKPFGARSTPTTDPSLAHCYFERPEQVDPEPGFTSSRRLASRGIGRGSLISCRAGHGR